MSPLAQVLSMANHPAPAPPQTTVQPTNVAGIYANNDAQNMDAYKAQIAANNAKWGGLASLGSAIIGGGSKLLGGGSGGGMVGPTSVGGAPLAGGASSLTQSIASALPFLFA
jgi:hypothetical protein